MKVLLQGDSLAEQHFLAMLCHAWTTNLSVTLQLIDDAEDKLLLKSGVVWEAVIGDWFTLRFVRQDRPTPSPKIRDYAASDILILGGFHHGTIDRTNVASLVDYVCPGEKGHNNSRPAIIVAEPMPNHFPGGAYRFDQKYPNATIPNFVCDASNPQGDPDVDVHGIPGTQLLSIRELYTHRGDAHIGPIPKGVIGPQGRDCLHWCIAPGVLDALAKQTLVAIGAIIST